MSFALRMRRVFAPVLLSVVSCLSAAAQTGTATLSGFIADPSGGVVPDVEVTATRIETVTIVTTKTNGAGIYFFTGLMPGHYHLVVRKPGFKEIAIKEFQLYVQDKLEQNFSLEIGSVSETVTVMGTGLNVNTTDGSVSTVVDRRFVANLPLNGRSFQALISLAPGTVATPTFNGPGEFSVNGQRQNANYFTVDGVSANTGVALTQTGGGAFSFSQQAGGAIPGTTALGTTASLVSIDALEEFRIQTSTYSAEFGRQPGGQVQLVTRSGANQFHGTLFEYLRNDALDAQDWFNGPTKALFEQQDLPWEKPRLRQNQFGGTFSGPIFKNKTFFFFSYEGLRLVVPVTNVSTFGPQVVPAQWVRQTAAPSLQPFLNAFPLPNGPEIQVLQFPTQPFDPVNNPFVPSGFAPIATSFSSPSSVDAYSLRVDHAINDKLKLFGRYAQTPSDSLSRGGFAPPNQLTGAVADNRTFTLGATLLATPRLNNEFRFNYTSSTGRQSSSVDNLGGAVPVTAAQLSAPYNGPQPVIARFDIFFFAQDSSYLVGNAADNRQRQLNFVDNLSWAKGKHQLKFGVDWRHLTPVYGIFAYLPIMNVSTDTFPPDHSDFLSRLKSGTIDLSVRSFKGAKPIYDNVSAYVADTWKLSPRLTLDVGARWEVNPPPHDANGVEPILITGISGTDVTHATLAPAGTPLYKTIYTAFAPRVGAAYQLNQRSGRETVLRGGFGVFYDLGSDLAAAAHDGYPFSSSTTLLNVTLPLTAAEAQQPPFPADPSHVTLPLHQGALYALSPNLKLPYTLQWNVALEQALGNQQTFTLSYVASAGRRLTITQDLNEIPENKLGQPGDPNQFRANPNFDNILYVRNAPTSDYESFQAQYQRRLSRGLQALVGYTWSHAIDLASFGGDLNTTLTRSNAAFDVRHSLSAAFTYDFPKLGSMGPLVAPVGQFIKAIANGWSIDSIITARTGTPQNVTAGFINLPDGKGVAFSPDVVPGQPVWIGDSTVPGGQRLNINAFAFPASTPCPGCLVDPIYKQGNLARNSIRLPGIYQINMGIRRQFNLGERWKLQANVEAFNVLNHPLFGNYDNLWFPGSTTFGMPFSMLSSFMGAGDVGTSLSSQYQNGGPRSMQVSLKLQF